MKNMLMGKLVVTQRQSCETNRGVCVG